MGRRSMHSDLILPWCTGMKMLVVLIHLSGKPHTIPLEPVVRNPDGLTRHQRMNIETMYGSAIWIVFIFNSNIAGKRLVFIKNRYAWNSYLFYIGMRRNEFQSQTSDISTLRHVQNGRHFAGDLFKRISFCENYCMLIHLILFLRSIGSNNGLAPNRWQNFIWTNDGGLV